MHSQIRLQTLEIPEEMVHVRNLGLSGHSAFGSVLHPAVYVRDGNELAAEKSS